MSEPVDHEIEAIKSVLQALTPLSAKARTSVPYSKGGTSLLADNIQLLCARHNIQKRDRIE